MIDVKGVNLNQKWNELPIAGKVVGGGTSAQINTGDWRVMIPKFHPEKCTQCMLCFPSCPDSAIPVIDGKRQDFDYMHCKGCGVCYKSCFPKAITWDKEDK